MTLILPRANAIAAMVAHNGARIDPRLTADGRLGVSDKVLTDPAYSDLAAVLAGGTANQTVSAWGTSYDPTVLINNQPMTLNSARNSYSLAEPATDVFRMEIHNNDSPIPSDSAHGNRRCEIVSLPANGYTSGQTLWMAWSTILGTQHTGMVLTDDASRFGYIMQVHPVILSIPLAPCVVVNCAQNQMRIMTASDAQVDPNNAGYGVQVVRWTGALPAAGAVTNFVMAVTLGQSGHLSAWVNGTKVVDADMPIGYYTNGGILGYPQWGVYEKNWNTTEVAYVANMEWGTSSLAARASSPLPVPDLSPWA